MRIFIIKELLYRPFMIKLPIIKVLVISSPLMTNIVALQVYVNHHQLLYYFNIIYNYVK